METLRHFHRFEKENTVAMVILLSVRLMEWLLHGNQASPAVKHAHGPAVQLFCEVYDFVLCSKQNETNLIIIIIIKRIDKLIADHG